MVLSNSWTGEYSTKRQLRQASCLGLEIMQSVSEADSPDYLSPLLPRPRLTSKKSRQNDGVPIVFPLM